MKTQKSKLILLIYTLSMLASCAKNTDKTQDPNTGDMVTKTCVNPLTPVESLREKIYLTDPKLEIVKLTTTTTAGSRRIIRLYNQTTCASRLDTDQIGDADTSVTADPEAGSWFGLYVQSGENKVYFTIDECQTIENQQCLGPISSDSGYSLIYAP